MFCSPKTGPPIMLVFRDDKVMEKGAVIYEEEQVHRGVGGIRFEAGRVRYTGVRSMPQNGDQRTDFLSMEEEVRRHGCG